MIGAVGVLAGGEVDGALVDVRGQDGRARGGVGQGQSDRPPSAAQVQQEAGLGRVGDAVEEDLRALVQTVG